MADGLGQRAGFLEPSAGVEAVAELLFEFIEVVGGAGGVRDATVWRSLLLISAICFEDLRRLLEVVVPLQKAKQVSHAATHRPAWFSSIMTRCCHARWSDW